MNIALEVSPALLIDDAEEMDEYIHLHCSCIFLSFLIGGENTISIKPRR